MLEPQQLQRYYLAGEKTVADFIYLLLSLISEVRERTMAEPGEDS